MIVRPATTEDATFIAARLREDDLDEIRRDHDTDVEKILVFGVMASEEALAYEDEGRVFAIGGVIRGEDGCGIVWQTGTPEIEHRPKFYLRETREIMNRWLSRYGKLHNLVGSRNRVSIRYLEHLGYTIEPGVVVLGDRQVPYQYFWVGGEANVQS